MPRSRARATPDHTGCREDLAEVRQRYADQAAYLTSLLERAYPHLDNPYAVNGPPSETDRVDALIAEIELAIGRAEQ